MALPTTQQLSSAVPLAGDDGSSSGGFFSGFNFATVEGQAPDVFQIVVGDTKLIWYCYAQQQGSNCQNGMVGVINQDFDGPNFTPAKHKELAAETEVFVIPPVQQGGDVIANPNPLGGFKF